MKDFLKINHVKWKTLNMIPGYYINWDNVKDIIYIKMFNSFISEYLSMDFSVLYIHQEMYMVLNNRNYSFTYKFL